VQLFENLKVVSMGFLLKGSDDAVIMRGPMKAGIVRQFLENVAWGELDFLVIDCPPGTGDEPLSVAQMLSTDTSSAIIVTTPQQMATIDVEKSITFCNQLGLTISGVIENMSGFVCPHCHKETDVFSTGGVRNWPPVSEFPSSARSRLIGYCQKRGQRTSLSACIQFYETAGRFDSIAEQLQQLYAVSSVASSTTEESSLITKKEHCMRFAVPTHDRKLCVHFGHCAEFAIIDVENNAVIAEDYIVPPPHEPGLLPAGCMSAA
jgi:anion-transporting  ArsA/GET3 family ATPase